MAENGNVKNIGTVYTTDSDQKCKVHWCAKFNPSASKRDQVAKQDKCSWAF